MTQLLETGAPSVPGWSNCSSAIENAGLENDRPSSSAKLCRISPWWGAKWRWGLGDWEFSYTRMSHKTELRITLGRTWLAWL